MFLFLIKTSVGLFTNSFLYSLHIVYQDTVSGLSFNPTQICENVT